MKYYFYIMLLIFQSVFANNDYQICKMLGQHLIKQCVIKPATVNLCSNLYNQYVSCITLLDIKHPLIYDLNRDDYKGNVFSPCGFEISHLILVGQKYCSNNW